MQIIDQLLRNNILKLKPYSSARDEFSGHAAVFLDANENPFNQPYNRYPDPQQHELKKKIAPLKGVEPQNIFLGNGSDEAIDLLIRAFCEPGLDNVVSISPTYGMYQVAADVNNIEVRKVKLTDDFQLDVEALTNAADAHTKLLFLCSPNNPTGNCFSREAIQNILEKFQGIVILDEAYIDFAPDKSWLPNLGAYPRLVILQTFSKAWGMAGIRLGMAFAHPRIIEVLNKIKYPYNVNILTQKKALELLNQHSQTLQWVKELLDERKRLAGELTQLPFVEKIHPSDANFLLVRVEAPKKTYQFLVDQGIIVRDRSSVTLCEGCLRITVGSPKENTTLMKALNNFH